MRSRISVNRRSILVDDFRDLFNIDSDVHARALRFARRKMLAILPNVVIGSGQAGEQFGIGERGRVRRFLLQDDWS